MEASSPTFLGFITLLSACLFFVSAHSNSPFIGIHPLDEKYYASDVIKCKDGSKSFNRDRLNDDFCDCVDGTDEPGTSACVAGRFYCRNVGSTPQFIFSSRVNDHFCDCCDGSDEYDGCVNCPNTCMMGGNSEYNTRKHVSKACDLNRNEAIEPKYGVRKEDLIEKVKGLKMVIILQVVLVCGLAVRVIYWRLRSKRRHLHRNTGIT